MKIVRNVAWFFIYIFNTYILYILIIILLVCFAYVIDNVLFLFLNFSLN